MSIEPTRPPDPDRPDLSVDEDTGPVLGRLLDHGALDPAPPFRDRLGERLTGSDPGWGPRPARLWTVSVPLVLLGALLILVGSLILQHG